MRRDGRVKPYTFQTGLQEALDLTPQDLDRRQGPDVPAQVLLARLDLSDTQAYEP